MFNPNEHRKNRYNNDIEFKNRIKGHIRKYNLKCKIECINHYSGGTMKCECCGESIIDFLTIDHENNDGAKHRREMGNIKICPWLVKNNFPEGFKVRCMNCNWGRRFTKICPHKIISNFK